MRALRRVTRACDLAPPSPPAVRGPREHQCRERQVAAHPQPVVPHRVNSSQRHGDDRGHGSPHDPPSAHALRPSPAAARVARIWDRGPRSASGTAIAFPAHSPRPGARIGCVPGDVGSPALITFGPCVRHRHHTYAATTTLLAIIGNARNPATQPSVALKTAPTATIIPATTTSATTRLPPTRCATGTRGSAIAFPAHSPRPGARVPRISTPAV